MRAKITSVIFIAMITAFFLLVMVLPKDETAEIKENRPLATMPEISLENIFAGSFTTDYEDYLTDNVGFRSFFVDFGTRIENSRGIEFKESGKIIELSSGGQLVLNDGKIMEVFKANPDAKKSYISLLNVVSKKIDAKAYLMLVPTQIEFDQSEYRPLSDSEKATIDDIYKGLDGIKGVNVYDRLKDSKDYIYFRTDHHWTQRGAYLGYEALMAETGDRSVPLSDLTHKKLKGFLGYLYNQANVPAYSKYADDIEYFEGAENCSVTATGPDEQGNAVTYSSFIYCPPTEGNPPLYSTFMGGDHALAEIETSVKNGKTALIIKDSYANAVLPLLCNNYEKLVIIDPRSYSKIGTIKDLTDKYAFDDLFVINYVFTTTATDYIDNLEKII